MCVRCLFHQQGEIILATTNKTGKGATPQFLCTVPVPSTRSILQLSFRGWRRTVMRRVGEGVDVST